MPVSCDVIKYIFHLQMSASCKSESVGVLLGGRLAGQRTGLLCGEGRQSCKERKDQLLSFRQRAVIEAGATPGAVARQSCSGRAADDCRVALCTLEQSRQKGLSSQDRLYAIHYETITNIDPAYNENNPHASGEGLINCHGLNINS